MDPARPGTDDPDGRWRALARLATAMLLAMTTWFSASAVVPQLRDAWDLDSSGAAMLTIAVQVGFVAGAVVSAALGLADRARPTRVILFGALGAATVNLGLVVVGSLGPAIALRFLTGMFLAGVYPPAMKAMATWFRRGRGTALGVMVGALTLGSSMPHLVNGLGGLDPTIVIVTTSVLTVVGGIIAITTPGGPFPFPRAPFRPGQALQVAADRRVRLASYGYFGHMWELYAMWAWIGTYLTTSFTAAGVDDAARLAAFGAFAAIGIGTAGCVVGGIVADRRSRTFATSLAMVASGGAAALAGPAWGGPPLVVLALVLFWGFWVVADSAQFSTLVTELADQRWVGTAVTLQLAAGFTLTVATIWLVPLVVDAVGWRWGFLLLVPGPVLGTLAMQRLAPLVTAPPGATAARQDT
ncbi:MFS transporter [Salsipaludibacter albus]|uniref:MFS transporter n=1 Tax=Salsipaludibacter albus TaxID=2849650 RepID=UPI001EE40884|nr:MFS transporter [Salsipaludibacter albus]MBY5163235.1 MFS transporter [Salsipaludibacter albus]